MNRALITRWIVGAALLLAIGRLAAALTGGFEHWTHESLRQAQAVRGERMAAAVALRDPTGEPWRPWGSGGTTAFDVTLVDFVFTRCVSICRSLGSTFQQLQARLAADGESKGRIGLVSITIDPGHDDGPALAGYARAHRADRRHWQVLRADAGPTQELLRSLGVVVIPDGMGGYAHNAALHLIDRSGRLRALYEPGDAWLALEHARRIAGAEQP